MVIDRSNYEIWIIDWLDGNLDPLRSEQLNSFLNENPDLREEFCDLNISTLSPSGVSFRNKERLRRSPSEISEQQFDYLCTAYLENDLSDAQRSELIEVTDLDSERKKSFELFQKTRLNPGSSVYRNKKALFRKTILQKAIRLSVIGLSTAAAILLIFTTYLNLHHNRSSDIIIASVDSSAGIIQKKAPEHIVSDDITSVKRQHNSAINTNNLSAGIFRTDRTKGIRASAEEPVRDSLSRVAGSPPVSLNKVPVPEKIDIRINTSDNLLVASVTSLTAPDPGSETERGKIGRFLAKNFRQKILKEQTPQDSPVKGYEIAEAGVTGLNKLFGWQMALDKKNDSNGQLKSIYFSSRILKFNAPVKKSEPSQ